jgi:hypothetical protein
MRELSQSEMDVLVVGAGPTGWTMAAELAARGVGCRIVDKTPVRSGRSRALVVHAPDSFLDSYHAERHPIGQRLLHTTDRMFNVAATRNPLLIALRNFLIPRVLPRVMGKRSRRARAFRFVSQLGIKYPDSPIVSEELGGADRAFRCGPAAGHRAPDGPLRLAGDGRMVSLFSRLREAPHQLLLFAGSTADGWSTSGTELHDLLTDYEGLLQPHLIIAREHAPKVGTIPVYVDEPRLLHERYGLKGAGYYRSGQTGTSPTARRERTSGRFGPTSRERSPHPLSSRLSTAEKGASYGCSRNSGFSTGRNVGRGP